MADSQGPTKSKDEATAGPDPVRIGVLCVHGIGEQQPGEFVSSVCESMRKAIAAEGHDCQGPVVAEPNPAGLGLTVAAQGGGPETTIEFHEAYWADLGDEPTFENRFKFWWWGFSMWKQVEHRNPTLPGAAGSSLIKAAREPLWKTQAKLFLVANMVAVLAFTLRTLIQILTWIPLFGRLIKFVFRNMRPIDTIVAYLGDVKTYQDQRIRMEPIAHQGNRARVAIRRRMIRQMVSMALAGYDRWYVFAHSLGTVVAFNGLMETAEALPNYLDRGTCELLRGRGWLAVVPGTQPAVMMPERPSHVLKDERLDRNALFENLHGFLTYGSPIDKFATLWRDIMYVNPEDDVFPEPFRWINVYELKDPVAGSLDQVDISYALRSHSPHELPMNYGYRTQHVFATAHTSYLSRPGKSGRLPRALAGWLLDPLSQFTPPQSGRNASGSVAQPSQWHLYAQLVITYLVILLFGGVVISSLDFAIRLDDGSSTFDAIRRNSLTWAGWLALGALAVVTLVGVVHVALKAAKRRSGSSDEQ